MRKNNLGLGVFFLGMLSCVVFVACSPAATTEPPSPPTSPTSLSAPSTLRVSRGGAVVGRCEPVGSWGSEASVVRGQEESKGFAAKFPCPRITLGDLENSLLRCVCPAPQPLLMRLVSDSRMDQRTSEVRQGTRVLWRVTSP